MNTIFSGLSGNSFRKAITFVAFIAGISVAATVSAQTVTAEGNISSITKPADEFQAFVHPVINTVTMKIHFVNPQKDYITISVYDQDGHLAYKKLVGKEGVYHGTFNMSKLTDGEYTVKVGSRKGTYSRTLILETQQKRFAMVQ